MRIKKGFTLRHIGDEHIVVAQGESNVDFNKLISLNSSSAYLFENLVDRDFSVADAADLLVGKYEVDNDTASADCRELFAKWHKAGFLED